MAAVLAGQRARAASACGCSPAGRQLGGGGPSLSTLRVRGERRPDPLEDDDCKTIARGLWARGLLRGVVGDGSLWGEACLA